MTLTDLEKRLTALEKVVTELQAEVGKTSNHSRRWWHDDAGRFADDPVFDEIVRLGREYRESLQPERPRKRAKKPHTDT